MEMKVAALLVGMICGLLLAAVILKVTKTDGNMKCKYDERQKAVRGKAYMMAFFTLLAYNLIYGVYGAIVTHMIVEPFTAMILGVFLALIVQISYAIWHDAYFSLNEDKKKVLWIFAVIGLLNLIIGIMGIAHEGIIENGTLTVRCTNLLCGCLFVYIFILYRLKMAKHKKEDEL